MNRDEIQQFKNAIKEKILPYAEKMTIKQIEDTIMGVEEIDKKFKNMLLEQIFIIKHNKNPKNSV